MSLLKFTYNHFKARPAILYYKLNPVFELQVLLQPPFSFRVKIMSTQMTKRKAYTSPKLTRLGSVETLTQAFGGLGSGDIIYTFTDGQYGKEGCYLDNSPLCTYGS